MNRLLFLTLAIVLVATGMLASCNYFLGRSQHSISLEGRWVLDSMGSPKDSAGIGLLLFALRHQDSAKTFFDFKTDSVYVWQQKREVARDTTFGHYSTLDSTLMITENADTTRFAVSQHGDVLKLTDQTEKSRFYLHKLKE